MDCKLDEIEAMFKASMTRRFSVSINSERNVKKKCALSYLFLTIADPDGLSQTLYIWLPHWSVYVSHSKDHATINFVEKVNEKKNKIKIKSKKIDAINEWNTAILKNVESYSNSEINSAQFSAKGTIDGSSAKLMVHMSPTLIYVTDKEGTSIYEAERGVHEINGFIPEDLTPRLKLQNDYQSIILKFKKDSRLGSALYMVNSKAPEVQSVSLISIDDTVVPELQISLTDLLSFQNQEPGSAVSSSSLFKLDDDVGNQAPVKSSIIVDESDPDVVKANLRRKYDNLIKKINITQNIDPSEVFEEIAAQHKRPTITVQPCDRFTLPKEKEKAPLFVMNDYVFKASKPLVHSPLINLKTEFNIEDCKSHLAAQNNIPKFSCPSKFKKYIDVVRKSVQSSEWSERPLYAAGIFLQGRKLSIEDIGRHLDSIIFTVYEIQIIVRNRLFNTKESILAMFNDLFKENLVYTFFNTLEYAHSFKREVYNCDSLVNTPGFCVEIAMLFDSPVQPVKYSNLPFSDDIVPHVRVAAAVQRLRTFKHVDSIERSKDEDETTSFDQIIFSVAYLLGNGPKTQLKDIWSTLEKTGRYADISAEDLSNEERTTFVFLRMISENKLAQYLVERSGDLKMSDRVEELILTAAQLVDINRMVLIADRGTIVEKTTNHVIDAFKLFE
jgi:hypothetical protein